MCSAARGVLLLAEHHVARTHRAAAMAPALTYAHTAERRVREAAVVLGELEVRLRCCGRVVRAEAQVRRTRVGIDHLAGVHLPLRIPDRFELPERLDELVPEHDRK